MLSIETYSIVRELKHSTDVRAVFLNNKILVTTDELKDIYLWDLETGASQSEASYQRQRNTCIRSLTGKCESHKFVLKQLTKQFDSF